LWKTRQVAILSNGRKQVAEPSYGFPEIQEETQGDLVTTLGSVVFLEGSSA